MKEKSGNHKATNTFHFQGFSERIRNLRVSATKSLSCDVSHETHSELFSELSKWQELNLTQGFRNFRSDIGYNLTTVPLVLFNEAAIAECFKTHLQSCDPICLKPILASLVGFATDILDVFYDKYFFDFIDLLKGYTYSKNHDTIEEVFVCLTSIFVILRNRIKKDIFKLLFQNKYISLFTRKHPWFVNELAAQSLSFIIRKLPNKKQCYTVIFDQLEKNSNQVEGIGRLVFNVFKVDVARRLHSSTADQLNIIFDIIEENVDNYELTIASLQRSFKHLAYHVSASKKLIEDKWLTTWQKDAEYVWPVFYKRINSALKDPERMNPKYVQAIINIYSVLLEHKNTDLLLNVDELLSTSSTIMKVTNDNELGATVFSMLQQLCQSERLTSDQITRIMISSFSSKISYKVLFPFIEEVSSLSELGSQQQQLLLEYIQSVVEDSQLDVESANELISMTASILMSRCTPVRCAKELKSWTKSLLDFTMILSRKSKKPKRTFMTILEERVSNAQLDLSNAETVILSCICISHLPEEHSRNCVSPLKHMLDQTINNLSEDSSEETNDIQTKRRKLDPELQDNNEMLMFLQGIVVETLYHILPEKNFTDHMKSVNFHKLLSTNVKLRQNIHYLKGLDIFLTSLQTSNEKELSVSLFEDLYPTLAPTLTSHHPVARMIVAHILSLFQLPMSWHQQDTTHNNLFKVFLEIEETPVDPFNFKERLRLLSLIDSDHIHAYKTKLPMTTTAPIHFLIGQLHVNFKDLWPGVMQNIAGHAKVIDIEQFWPLWHSTLLESSNSAFQELCGQRRNHLVFESENTAVQDLYNALTSHNSFGHLSSRQSAMGFRDQLWKAMLEFPEVCEKKSRDIVNLFLNFMHNEFAPRDNDLAQSQNISASYNKTEFMEIDEEDEDQENEDETSEDAEKAKPKAGRAPMQAFCSHVSLFARLRNPKSIPKSNELEALYEKFLSHPNPRAQRLALDALMAYKYKHLKPYKEFLYNLLDDKTMKDELALFSISGNGESENRSLKVEHRQKTVPVVLKLLYGRMHFKGTTGNGKYKAPLRKSVIMRFLGCCNPSELDVFLNLAFDIFIGHIEGDTSEVVQRATQNANPKEVIPLKRLQGAFASLEDMMDTMGNLLSDKHSMLLKIIFFTISSSSALLAKREEVSPHFFAALKKLKKVATHRIISFFKFSVLHPWSTTELECIFSTIVWPSLPQLMHEGTRAIPASLRLMESWAENHRYHVLLAKHPKDNPSLTPLPFLLKLSQHPNCPAPVTEVIMKIIHELLSPLPVARKDDIVGAELPVDKSLLVDCEHDLTIGEKVVYLCRNELLQTLSSSLSTNKATTSQLTVLVQIAPWISDINAARELCDVAMRLLMKKSFKSDEKVRYMLTVIKSLVRLLVKPELVVRDAVYLFSIIQDIESRTLLCELMSSIAIFKPDLKQLSEWCTGLNSWNGKMLDQLDLTQRMKCFKEIDQYLASTEILDVTTCLFYVHNSFWMIDNIERPCDIRPTSTTGIKKVLHAAMRVHSTQSHAATTVIDCVMGHVKNRLQHENVDVREQVMHIMEGAVHRCHTVNQRLGELFQLANEEVPEKDFFNGMCHAQSHRRGRALQQLANQVKDDTVKFSKNTITEYLIPMCGYHLFNTEFSQASSVISFSIECIGALSGKLPWTNYHSLLKHYIAFSQKGAKFIKTSVAVLEVIIDAFHEETREPVRNSEKDKLEPSKPDVVYTSLVEDLIPKLKDSLYASAEYDKKHKSNRSRCPEEDDVNRTPLAFVLIKLMKKLPKQVLHNNVHGILLKLLTFLKSKSDIVRIQSRQMLIKVMKCLGGDYLSWLVKDMNDLLTKGFHHHVMVISLHSVLHEMQADLEPSHINSCVDDMLDICIRDTFGIKNEEKSSNFMSNLYGETNAERGYDIIVILGRIVSTQHLQLFITSLDEVLQTQDKKVVTKVSMMLHKFAHGLETNSYIDLKSKSVFLHALVTEKLDHIKLSKEEQKASSMTKCHRVQADSFIIVPEPRKAKALPQVVDTVKSHVFVDFSLHLLHELLRHKQFSKDDQLHRQLLDSYAPIMSECMMSEYPQVCINALHVVGFLVPYNLPSVEKSLSGIFVQMFLVLDKFASFKQAKGKNYEMVQLIFKTLSTMISKVELVQNEHFQQKHIQVLLVYARDNLPDSNQHHSTFSILKAIVKRKINCQELHSIMDIIREMSVKNENTKMLDQARSTYREYLLNYPKAKGQHVKAFNFYLENTEYPQMSGRKSAIYMLEDLVGDYPTSLFTKPLEMTCMIQLGKCVLKEQCPELKTKLSSILNILYAKSKRKEMLMSKSLELLQNVSKSKPQKAVSVHMGAQTLIPFLKDSTIDQHPTMFSKILPEVVQLLNPERFVLDNKEDDMIDQNDVIKFDLSLNSLLQVFACLCELYFNSKSKQRDALVACNAWNYMTEHLCYPNLETRLHSVTLLNNLFEYYSKLGQTPPMISTEERLHSLTVNLCDILTTNSPIQTDLLKQMTDQVVRSLLFLIKTTETVALNLSTKEGDELPTEKGMANGAYWVLHKVGMQSYHEMKYFRRTRTTCREAFLKLIAAVILTFQAKLKEHKSLRRFMLAHLAREVNDPRLNECLKPLTEEVSLLLKDQIGADTFDQEFREAESQLDTKKFWRKNKMKESLISNPECAAKKKLRKNEKKHESRKRKASENILLSFKRKFMK